MLLSNENNLIRVLQNKGDRSLVIDCIKRTMPKWIATEDFAAYTECSEADLYNRTGMIQNRVLSQGEQCIAQEHFTMIAAVLPFIGNEPKRNEMIDLLSENCSKQTIRKYLCLYLVYQNLAALAPVKKADSMELTQDEKNIRWGLNKFFYTQHKNSLSTAYTMLLQAKYCDAKGQLVDEYPSFNQFRYFYRKTKKMQQFYISRDGLKHYQRNNRPLLGDGVQQFAPAVGVGMLDSTICDIYLVDDGGKLVGRPVMTACIDAFSGLCCGYSLGWEGGTYSLRSLMLNVIADKQEWCKSHGVFIKDGEWETNQMPAVLVTDMGSEYKGDTFSQIAELGIKIVNLPPYRPELKGMVEKFFDVIQNTYKKHLKGKGVIEPDYQERGAQEVQRTYQNFKVGYVFAYEDTSGKPLPSIVSILDQEVDSFDTLMNALQTVSPVPIRFAPIQGSANGYYDLEKREICVDSSLPQLQQVKTSIHEIAHSLLHDRVTGEDPLATQREMEVSAESVAFVVCSYLGLDTSEYSFGYVGGWSAGKELKELQEKMEVIRKAANTIISGIEAELMENTICEVEEKPMIPEITVVQEKPQRTISHRRR